MRKLGTLTSRTEEIILISGYKEHILETYRRRTMGRKKKETIELRYYDIPQKEYVMALLGEEWIRDYGSGVTHLHFHNMMEIGYCRDGRGTVTLDEDTLAYEPETLCVIPKNYPHTTDSEDGRKSYWEYLYFDPETILRNMYPDNELYQNKLLRLINRKAHGLRARDYPQTCYDRAHDHGGDAWKAGILYGYGECAYDSSPA